MIKEPGRQDGVIKELMNWLALIVCIGVFVRYARVFIGCTNK